MQISPKQLPEKGAVFLLSAILLRSKIREMHIVLFAVPRTAPAKAVFGKDANHFAVCWNGICILFRLPIRTGQRCAGLGAHIVFFPVDVKCCAQTMLRRRTIAAPIVSAQRMNRESFLARIDFRKNLLYRTCQRFMYL